MQVLISLGNPAPNPQKVGTNRPATVATSFVGFSSTLPAMPISVTPTRY